jgi:hypothetical protein
MHYAVDALAGILTAAAVVAAGLWLEAREAGPGAGTVSRPPAGETRSVY